MKLNENKIRQLVKQYQENQDQASVIKAFQKEVELYIYAFPKLSYRRSPDECADFYLYVLERLHTIIRNFPPDSPVKFKTWFNYVLKNQFVNFYRRKQKNSEPVTLDLEPMESELAFNQEFYQEEEDSKELRKAILKLPQQESILIKLYYMPERINAQELSWISNHFKLNIKDCLTLRNNLIFIHEQDSKRIRKNHEQLNEINRELVDLKYRLKQENNLKESNKLLLQIARKENSKFKLVRTLVPSEKKLFAEFAILFKNIRRAREHLNFAKRSLKTLLIGKMKKNVFKETHRTELF